VGLHLKLTSFPAGMFSNVAVIFALNGPTPTGVSVIRVQFGIGVDVAVADGVADALAVGEEVAVALAVGEAVALAEGVAVAMQVAGHDATEQETQMWLIQAFWHEQVFGVTVKPTGQLSLYV
jgi:hypothetical protein